MATMPKKKPHPLFREIPPWAEVCSVLHQLGLSADFPLTFTKDDILMKNSEDAVAVLYGYYLPCKAKQFLDEINQIGWIIVLKHCLIAHGYSCKRQETSRSKKKIIIYTIEKVIEDLQEDVVIDFL